MEILEFSFIACRVENDSASLENSLVIPQSELL